MAIQIDHFSSDHGAMRRHRLELLDFEPREPASDVAAPPSPAPTPAQAPTAAPTPDATPATLIGPIAPTAWVQHLPDPAFGPLTVRDGGPPSHTALNDLAPAPAVAVIETPPAAAAPVAPAAPTASALEIATLELTLADPLNRELVRVHGGALQTLDPATAGPVLQEQIARYGADLTARLSQLAQANSAVRNLYLQAMDEAARTLGPGTPGTPGAVFVPGSWGGGDSDPVPDRWRFDPVAFTQAYAQAGLAEGAPLAQRAFAALHGTDPLQTWERSQGGYRGSDNTLRGHTLDGSFELTAPTYTDNDGHPSRERMAWTGAHLNPDSHALRPIALATPPELHNPQAVWFDARLGWVTPGDNVVVKQDFLDKAIPVVFIATMTWATAGAFGVAGGAGVTAGTGIGAAGGLAGAMTAGAAFGAIGGFYSGLIQEGKFDLGGMLRGALTGAVTAGIADRAGFANMGVNRAGQVTSYAERALAVTGQATLQGALQKIAGGEFKDGFTAGLAQGLGTEIARGLNLKIAELQAGDNPIDDVQAGALRQFARVAQSAVSLLGNPDDPGHAFAMTFVNGLVSDVQAGLTGRETGAVQGAGPWSDADYRNGSDIESDLANEGHVSPGSPAWIWGPDETAAETARLVRSGTPDAAILPETTSALWPSLSMSASGASGLRLSPAAVAEFQASLQQGTDLAAADPAFNAATYAQQRLDQLLADGSMSDDIAMSLEEEPVWLAGPGGPRTGGQTATGRGLQLNVNQRANTVFDALGNAPVGDAFGLVPEAYRDIKLLAPLMQESRLRGEIERMRTVLGQSGFDVSPEKLGAVPGIDANGRISFDQADLADRYANAIRLLELRRQGVIEFGPSGFTVGSVGTARITPQELVRNVEQRYQAAFAQGLNEAQRKLEMGVSIGYPANMPQQLQLGLAADHAAKVVVRDYLSSIGVPEGPGQIVALNRWAYDREGSGLYVRPDVFFDFGPDHRHFLDGKSSFVNNGVLTRQLHQFFGYTGSQTGAIASHGGTVGVRAPRGRP